MKLPMPDQILSPRRPLLMAGVVSRKIHNQTNQPMKRILTSLTALVLSAFATVASAQVTMIQTAAIPVPGPLDIYNVIPYYNNDGLNYFDNNATPPGQTFTTGSNVGGYTLTNLVVKTAGAGGGSETSSQTYVLNIYS